MAFVLDGPNVRYGQDSVESSFVYEAAIIERDVSGALGVRPQHTVY